LRARRGGARLAQKQGRGRGADLLHMTRILVAPTADVNSMPSLATLHGGHISRDWGIERDFQSPTPSAEVVRTRWTKSRARNRLPANRSLAF
jgi:hypothetical protein